MLCSIKHVCRSEASSSPYFRHTNHLRLRQQRPDFLLSASTLTTFSSFSRQRANIPFPLSSLDGTLLFPPLSHRPSRPVACITGECPSLAISASFLRLVLHLAPARPALSCLRLLLSRQLPCSYGLGFVRHIALEAYRVAVYPLLQLLAKSDKVKVKQRSTRSTSTFTYPSPP